MITVGEGNGFPCEIITECGGVTELCVENTQGCAFTANCNCTIQSVCNEYTCQCTDCTPCTQRTCGCTCSACTAATCGGSICRAGSLCGISFQCTPTNFVVLQTGLRSEHLAELKDQLRKAMDEVDTGEQRLRAGQEPQSVEEIARLEEKLTEALSELRQRRDELEGRQQGKQ